MVQSSQPGIAEDDDSSIQYFGSWATIRFDEDVGDTSSPPSISPGDTVRETRHPEAIAKFSFTGTSVSVHGLVVQGCQPPMEFILDSGEPETTQENLRFSHDCWEGSSSQHIWFSRDNLTPGDHVLTIQMSEIVSQDDEYFILDYIQYTPLEATTNIIMTATTITTLPVASTMSSTSITNTRETSSETASPQTTQNTISQHSINNTNTRSGVSDRTLLTTSTTAIQRPTSLGSGVSNSSLTTSITKSQLHGSNITLGTTLDPLPSQTRIQQQLSHTSRSVPIGAIVGAVLGTLALVLVVLFFWCKRTRTRLFDTSDKIARPFKFFPSSVQPQSVKKTLGPPTSTALNPLLQGDTADHSTSEPPSNLRLQEVVTRLEREFSEMQVRYAQLEGYNISGTNSNDRRQTQFILPPPYDRHETSQVEGTPLQQVRGSSLPDVHHFQQYPDSYYPNRLSGTSRKLPLDDDMEGPSPSHTVISQPSG